LRGVLRDRQAAVDTLLQIKRGESTEKEKEDAPSADNPTAKQSPPALKRYRNE
jgi:hypothetical protein